MGGRFRWDDAALAAFNARAEQWRSTGTVRTHECKDTPTPGGKRKFKNTPTMVEGEKFQSKKEAKRWIALKTIEHGGRISGLQRQVKFSLDINGVHICDYIADFVYRDERGMVAEDCKGFRTDVYKMKKVLMKAIHNIDVVET